MSSVVEKLKKSRKTVVVIVAIAVIPLIYAGLLTWANQDPAHNLDSVPAAVVNEDQPASTEDGTVNLGESLTEELTSSTAGNNFDWRSMDADDAEDALASGEVLAVMTIPSGFSAAAVSPADNDAATARPATLSIETNDSANMIAGTIASTIASTVRESLATQVSSEYLKNVYLGFTTVHDKMAEASDGATQLADGAASAADGSATLVAGLDELADGTSLLVSGAQSLANGAAEANTGAQSLSGGLAELQSQTAPLPDQTAQLAAGASTAATGAANLATALDQLETGSAGVSTGTDQALAGASQLSGGLNTLAEESPALATGAENVSTGLANLLTNYDSLNDLQRKATLAALSNGAAQVSTGAQTVQTSSAQLAAGGQALVGSEATNTGLSALSVGAKQLATGTAAASSGADQLKTGTAQVAAGTATLSSKMPELTAGISNAATGSRQLADGVSQVSSGATALADKSTALGSGATNAAAGASTLNDGLIELDNGATQLSEGLTEGVDQVPSYTDAEASALSDVTSDPVRTDFTRKNEVPAYGYALAPYFTALALWVGAIGYFLIMPALSRRALNGGGSGFLVATRSFMTAALVAVVQSALVTLILINGVGLNVANGWGLFGMITLASLTFVAINQALIALLGDPGRFLALILIVLQLSAAGGTYPIQTSPTFFQAIHPWFPLTYAVESFRSLIAGGTLGQAQGIVVMAVWLVAALAVTVVASFRARQRMEDAEAPRAVAAAA